MTQSAERTDDIVELIADIFLRRGADAYLGEPVTMAEHMLQTATLAHGTGAADMLVVAALLHDIGHFTSEFGTYSPDDTVDRFHDAAGAGLLAGHFPAEVVETVRLHVVAKRYLCTVEQGYFDALSAASKHSFGLQGGPMDRQEVDGFRLLAFHEHAVRVRRWDDQGKVAGIGTMAFEEFRPLLRRAAGA
jgi:predicted HD phosphohydrolase